ncbi:MAG: hypothetical protein KJ799_06655 [Bacteroidetes bacterium]|nr:hypothetical protein [Bacteroidota bacterium]
MPEEILYAEVLAKTGISYSSEKVPDLILKRKEAFDKRIVKLSPLRKAPNGLKPVWESLFLAC